MSYLSGEVKENLDSLSNSLAELSKHLHPLQQFKSLQEMNSRLLFEDSLKVNTVLAYSLSSLYYILLKLQGKNLSQHRIIKDIENIRAIAYKVQQALSRNKISF